MKLTDRERQKALCDVLECIEDDCVTRGELEDKVAIEQARQAIEALHESEDRLRKALESIVSNLVCHMPRDHKRSTIWKIASEALK